MATSSEIESNNDPYEDMLMRLNGLYLPPDSPMLLQSSFKNKFEITSSTLKTEFRLGVASGQSLIGLEPDSSTWVKFQNGSATWSITPGSEEGSPVLVLYGRDFNKVLEFRCEFFGSTHPLYSSSAFLVGGPFVWGYPTHKAVIPLARTRYRNRIAFVAQNRIGEVVRLKFFGEDGIPDITSVNPQPMVDGGVGWDFSFEKSGEVRSVTAQVEFVDGAKTQLDFVPTDKIETVSSELEQSGEIDR